MVKGRGNHAVTPLPTPVLYMCSSWAKNIVISFEA